MVKLYKFTSATFGGILGWLVTTLEPSFPLLLVATIFILYDVYTAYELDKRVRIVHPEKKKKRSKVSSYKLRTVICALKDRLFLILLAYCADRCIRLSPDIHFAHIMTGCVCGEQMLSILENMASCRLPGDKHVFLWKFLSRILVDKTARHFDIPEEELKEMINNDKK